MSTYLSIVYVSTACHPFSEKELLELLDKSRKNNMRLGITGMLLHEDGNFMQAIEGPAESVRQLHEIILADPRHTGIITLLEQEVSEREFGEWHMAFRNIAAMDTAPTEGYSQLLNNGQIAQNFLDDPGRAMKLLLSFRRSLRLA